MDLIISGDNNFEEDEQFGVEISSIDPLSKINGRNFTKITIIDDDSE